MDKPKNEINQKELQHTVYCHILPRLKEIVCRTIDEYYLKQTIKNAIEDYFSQEQKDD